MKLFAKYRPHFSPLAWYEHLSQLYNMERGWYVQNCDVKITDWDQLISMWKYKDSSKNKFLAQIEFNETKVTPEDLAFDINQYRGTNIYTIDEAINFMKSETDCEEIETNKFLVKDWYTDELWNVHPAEYLDFNLN